MTAKKSVAYKFHEDFNDKLKYIAWHDRTSVTAILEEAGQKVIAAFEKKNGEITVQQIAQAKK